MEKIFLLFITLSTICSCANMNGSYNKDTSDVEQVNSPMTSSRAASS